MNDPLTQPLLDENLELKNPAEAAAPVAGEVNLDDPSLYLNRELTWLAFNRRVLHEAEDDRTPLLERVKFLAIVSANLDEFFMKRIGGLKQQVGAGVQHAAPWTAARPAEQIDECLPWCGAGDACASRGASTTSCTDLLAKQGHPDRQATPTCSPDAGGGCASYFRGISFPLLTPQAHGPGPPLPLHLQPVAQPAGDPALPGGSEPSIWPASRCR